jgi:cardiolipin synthase
MAIVIDPPLTTTKRTSNPFAAPLATPELLVAQTYIADATRLIANARTRVYLMALTIADGKETDRLIDALVTAAGRGVTVHLAADVFTYADAAGAFLPKRYQSKRRRASSTLARKVTASGATFTWLGSERGLIFRGRTHTKFCVVDDVAYSFGGVNLDDQGATNVDYMVKVTDRRLADALVAVYERVKHMNGLERGYRSKAVKFGKDQVLIDGGLVGDSIIYRRALKYARKARRVLLISQYCPTGELGAVIKSKPHELYFNPPSNASFLNHVLIRASMVANRTSTRYRKKQYLHAKCIVFYLKNGKRVAITGSHNFVYGGVMLGTREIALQTKNPHLIDQIETFFSTHVAQPNGAGHHDAG